MVRRGHGALEDSFFAHEDFPESGLESEIRLAENFT
jgi:hypothetical protein